MVQLSNFFYTLYNFLMSYPTPMNIGYLWNFGVCSLIFLIIQILSGFFLSMNYVPNSDLAFMSVENMMSNMNFGRLISYIHSNGASFFFLCVYMHMFSGIFYTSFIKPSQNVWNIGVMILLLMIVAAFTGYVLPWGQMSFWAATVMTNLASAVPFVGDIIVIWLWGGYSMNTFTLNSFFSLHYMLPFIILLLVIIHMMFLHEKGSSNKLMFTYKIDKMMFHPYFTMKDMLFALFMLLIFSYMVGFSPDVLSHPDNYMQADPLVTPAHIVPEWYFLPFYSMLSSIPSKLGGVVVLLLSMVILILFPIFYNFKNYAMNLPLIKYEMNWSVISKFFCKINLQNNLFLSKMYLVLRSFSILGFDFNNVLFVFFMVSWLSLTYMGGAPIEYPFMLLGSMFTFFYFFYFVMLVMNSNFYYLKFLLLEFTGLSFYFLKLAKSKYSMFKFKEF